MLPLTRPLKIATHSGTFHCDEVVAISMLRMLVHDEYELVRTRDLNLLDQADIVVDVGGVFNPDTLRFDHHQRGFDEGFSDAHRQKSKLSSAGLIYKYFGRKLLLENFRCPERFVDRVFTKVYDNFVLSVDAIDNGVDVADVPRYAVKTDLASRVRRLNPTWLEEGGEDERFRKAMDVATEEINAQIKGIVDVWLPAREIVENAVGSRFEYHPSGRILKLPQYCPWIEHLFDIEDEEKIGEKRKTLDAEILFCIFADQSGQFRVRAVPKTRDSFDNRLPLPERLRGLSDEKVSEIAGIEGLVFVHKSGFIGGAKTEASAVRLAEAALAELSSQ